MRCFYTLYYGTGFNSINIPDSAETLAAAAGKIVTGTEYIDVVDPVRCASIDIQTTGVTDLMGVDYIAIGPVDGSIFGNVKSVFYYVSDWQMTSETVARVTLIPDYLTTVGISNLNFTDGTVVRSHAFGDEEAPIEDEFYTPQYPLSVDGTVLWGRGSNVIKPSVQDTAIIESTVRMDYPVDWDKAYVITAPSAETGAESVYQLQPKVNGVASLRTWYSVDVNNDKNYFWSESPSTKQYLADSVDELQTLQSLGVTSAIISSVLYPKEFFAGKISSQSLSGAVDLIQSELMTESSGLAYDEPYTRSVQPVTITVQDRNKNAIFKNKYNMYGMLTAAGDQAEYLPSEVLASGSSTPNVCCLADPKPTGKPYFRFEQYLKKNSSGGFSSIYDYIRGALSGLQWANAPLVYQGASGSYFNTLRYSNAQQSSSLNYQYSRATTENAITSNYLNKRQADLNDALSIGSSFLSMDGNVSGLSAGAMKKDYSAAGDVLGIARSTYGIVKTASDMIFRDSQYNLTVNNNALSLQYAQRAYELNQELTAANYVQSQTAAPTVQFPYNANMLRDFGGNGVYVYRYYYDGRDVNRINKLLNMYGHKVASRALTRADFTGRKYFNFIQAGGTTVTSVSNRTGFVLPRFIKDSLSAILSGGVRIWHTKPNTSYYEVDN